MIRTQATKTTLKVNKSFEGETIEKKLNRIVNNKEPIKDGAPITYTDRKDGVIPGYNIRTDRFDEALDLTEKIAMDKLAKRDQRAKEKEKSIGEQAKDGMSKETGGQSVDGTPQA